MKVLFVPYGTGRAPATRYRVMQYLPFLKKQGVDFRVVSAISGFSTNLMIKSPDFNPWLRFIYYIYVFLERSLRLTILMSIAWKFDLVFFQRTTLPFRFEILTKSINKNIIFDIDDAIYLPDNENRDFLSRFKRYIKETEVINMLKISKAVIVENEYIKDYVSHYCKSIFKIPGPIDTERFFVRGDMKTEKVTIGWIGSPATTPYLHMMDKVFKNISDKYPKVLFKFIGLGNYDNPAVKFEKVDWGYNTEVRMLQTFDIGIMPMPDNEWTRGKLGCKMLQYMAVGVPAVVSYTLTNAEMIKNGENGYFAKNEDDWTKILSTLIEDGSLRRKVGLSGRQTVLEKCALSENTKRLTDIFEKIKMFP